MAKIKDIKELRAFFLELEKKYDLLDFEIDGVKPWQLMRVSIDYELGKILGIMEEPFSTVNKKEKFLNLLSLITHSIIKNPFFAKKVDIIVFPHSRVKEVDLEMIDIYTHYFTKSLEKASKSFIEIENPYKMKHVKAKHDWRYYNDFILIIKNILSKFIKVRNIDIKYIKTIENEISIKIGHYDLLSLFIKTVKKYKVEYFFYKKLLQKIKPKQIYLVVSYDGFGSLIKAAKDLGIEVIELQHGNFSKYHFGYYFGEGKKELDYFPDKFYVWNEYWKSRINFPIDDENIIIKKFDYLEYRKNLYSHVKKLSNQAVVLSQGVLGDRIAKTILDNWSYFKQFKIIYKLHPGEYDKYQEYKNLIKLKKEYNIQIVKDVDLYELFALSEYQIGIFSTALYEGIEFDCKTILLSLPGIEEMDSFQKIYKVEVI